MILKKRIFSFTGLLVLPVVVALSLYRPGMRSGSEPIDKLVNRALSGAVVRAKALYAVVDTMPGRFPRSVGKSGQVETCDAYFWTSGFFPGALWYLYEYSSDSTLLGMAERMTRRVEQQKFNRNSHDVGFMINCPFGNAYRISGDTSYVEPLITAARSLASRFSSAVGCTRSWSGPHSARWQFPVIIDNMLNLELLCRASQLTGDPRFAEIAVRHARTTMKNHFRADYSSCHVVDYDPASGEVLSRSTWQGCADSSSWSRGQAWGLYGFTMMYRETGCREFLYQARHIADFMVRHPRLPEDGIPYWDFDDPRIPDSPRDASAAAIMASALIELSRYAEAETAAVYLKVAERQLRTLASEEYTAPEGENGNFILRHGVGFLPAGSEVDVPLSYADYYYIEALMRHRALHSPLPEKP